jgi:hypothetical protein
MRVQSRAKERIEKENLLSNGSLLWWGATLLDRLFSLVRHVSGIQPGYSCKEGRIVEDGLLVEFPCTPTRTRSVYSY